MEDLRREQLLDAYNDDILGAKSRASPKRVQNSLLVPMPI